MANVLPPYAKIKRAALDLLFPQWCIGCGREGEYLCVNCRESLPIIVPPVCLKCGRPLPPDSKCRGCTEWSGDIDGIRSPFLFTGLIREAVHQFKYGNLRAIASFLAWMLYDYMTQNPITGDVLVPVPLHRKRWRERGYNQSALLAGELSKLCGLPVMANSLKRRSIIITQAKSHSVIERRKNVEDAFYCIDPAISGKRVILIDDVSTSGATANSCAAALKMAGAVKVWGLVVALEL